MKVFTVNKATGALQVPTDKKWKGTVRTEALFSTLKTYEDKAQELGAVRQPQKKPAPNTKPKKADMVTMPVADLKKMDCCYVPSDDELPDDWEIVLTLTDGAWAVWLFLKESDKPATFKRRQQVLPLGHLAVGMEANVPAGHWSMPLRLTSSNPSQCLVTVAGKVTDLAFLVKHMDIKTETPEQARLTANHLRSFEI